MLPDHEKTRIPEGHYSFQIMSEPEKRSHTSQATGKKFISIKFELKATNDIGETFDFSESFLAFEDKYADLLIALGAKEKDGRLSGSTIEPIGMTFRGDIEHQQDKNDSTKTWARIAKIKPIMDESAEVDHQKETETPAEDDDECPF